MNKLTLGSLFDGSGGFPLGGLISGITPVWASEVELFPVRVTTKRLPFMKHYGDVSVLKGAELPPVDIITFGSPCQDMSIAGKRSGLDGSRGATAWLFPTWYLFSPALCTSHRDRLRFEPIILQRISQIFVAIICRQSD